MFAKRSARSTLTLCLCTAGLLVGCTGDDDDDGGANDGDSTTESHATGHMHEDSGPTDSPTGADGTAAATTTGTATGEESGTADGTTGDPTGGSSDSTGEPADVDVTLQFAANVGAETAVCGTDYADIGTANNEIQFRDIRMYVSNIRLVTDADDEVPLALEQDGAWQSEDVVLLDFEDGTAACSETGTAEMNTVAVGVVPGGVTYTGVRFDLGVPAALNHTDVNLAESPLNVLEMNWNWLAGRKFVRIDLTVDELPPNNNYNIHLGSQGCANGAPSDPMMPPGQDCTRPQRPAVALDAFDHTTDTIVADVAALLDGVDISANIAGAPGCMSFFPPKGSKAPVDEDCDAMFPNYGMDWQTGDCEADCAGQVFFSVE